eukprot:7701861-Ditylum_brightwellii.AAC.2
MVLKLTANLSDLLTPLLNLASPLLFIGDLVEWRQPFIDRNFTQQQPVQCLFFHHGQPQQQGRGSGRTIIFLEPKGKAAWQLAGSPDPVYDNLVASIAQVIGLKICKKGS